MRRGQRASSSSESEESQQSRSEDSVHRPSSEEGESSSDSDVEVRHGMKRSQRFCSSFSFGEDGEDPKGSNGVITTQAMETGETGEHTRQEKQDTLRQTNAPQRSCLFRPQELWLAVTRCLTLRWPPCLTVNRPAYRVDADQSEDTGSPDSSTYESSSWKSSSDDADVKQDEEKVQSGSLPARRCGISCTTSRLPRARQALDPMLASMILDQETFLRVELIDSGEEREDGRYWAEWTLSARAKELAEGVWISKNQKPTD